MAISSGMEYLTSAAPAHRGLVVVGTASAQRSLPGLVRPSSGQVHLISQAAKEAPEVEAAREFMRLVRRIPDVRAVGLDMSGEVPRVTTYVSPRNVMARDLVHGAEYALSANSGVRGIEFRVVFVDLEALAELGRGEAGAARWLWRL